jgi:hypothetical protein
MDDTDEVDDGADDGAAAEGVADRILWNVPQQHWENILTVVGGTAQEWYIGGVVVVVIDIVVDIDRCCFIFPINVADCSVIFVLEPMVPLLFINTEP